LTVFPSLQSEFGANATIREQPPTGAVIVSDLERIELARLLVIA
jgi:hypothetical protein